MEPLTANNEGLQPPAAKTTQKTGAAVRRRVLKNGKTFIRGDKARRASHRLFTLDMVPTGPRTRRRFSDTEKEHIKQVRKLGACGECKVKKCKCTHVAVLHHSPHSSASEDNGPVTPESQHSFQNMNLAPKIDVGDCDFDFEDMIDFDAEFEEETASPN
ncbi:MAG: hypothetical protein Q9201_002394 [Fulgogasparrea decipioides]